MRRQNRQPLHPPRAHERQHAQFRCNVDQENESSLFEEAQLAKKESCTLWAGSLETDYR